MAGKAGVPLVYPRRLSQNQRELANRYLSLVAPHQRQLVLDELEGRFRSEAKGMQPLYDKMCFLLSLCNAMKTGEFKENLGVRVREERSAREKARQKRQQRPERRPEADVQAMRTRLAAGDGPVAEMRNALGLSSCARKQFATDEPH